MIKIGSQVLLPDKTVGLVTDIICNTAKVVEETGRFASWYSIDGLQEIRIGVDFAADGPEVEITKAYAQGYLTKETTEIVLMAIRSSRKPPINYTEYTNFGRCISPDELESMNSGRH